MESYRMLSSPSLALAVGIAVLVVAVLASLGGRKSTIDVPYIGLDGVDVANAKLKYAHAADQLLREGFEKFRNRIFQVMTPDGPRLFLPRQFANELKVYPRHEASGMKALADRHLGQYTTIDHESETMLNVIKVDLNRNLGNFVSDVAAEVDYIFETQFPSCEDWTAVDLHDKLLRVVAQASARIFVGPSLNRNEEWLSCTSKFALDAMIGGEKLKAWRPFLRPIAQYIIPEVRQIRGDHTLAHKLLLPTLKARAEAEKHPNYQKPNDMIQWIQDRARKLGDTSCDSKEQANIQLLVATAAIHTTRLAIVHAIYDLAARPEYIEPLRKEIIDVLSETDGVLTKQSLTHLKKLDSFMKESQRHSPPSLATLQRKVLIPIKLSNGFSIPANTIVQCSTNILEETPASWGNPFDFDGFRFYKLRRNPENANRFQFATPTYDSMQFGLGNDACPGRWFASNQIKIILVYFLTHYDMRFEEGQGRPKNFLFEVNVLADPTVKVWLKRRKN